MAVLGRLLISSAERLDLPDLLSIDSYTAGDFKYLLKGIIGDSKPYILKGFDVIDPLNAIGTQSCSIRVADSVVFYPGSNAGSFFHGLQEGHPQAEPLVPELRKNTVNYVYLTFNTFNSSIDTRAFWDPDKDGGVGGEFTQDVNTQSVLKVEVHVSTGSFPANTIPVAKVTVGPVVITAIEDARDLMFRLGSGGISPNPFNQYQWRNLPNPSFQRSEPPIKMLAGGVNPFQGADKNIFTLKEWMDAIMTKLRELGGTIYWYEDTSTYSLISGFIDANATAFKSKGKWIHNGTTPGLLTWTEDFHIKIASDQRTYIVRSSNKTLNDEQVMYLPMVRQQPFNANDEQVSWINGQNYINTIGGAIGLFANLSKGDYVKKINDSNDKFLRVEEFYDAINLGGSVTTPAGARSIRLSAAYLGTTGNEKGRYDKGVYLGSDVVVSNRNNIAISNIGGNFHWLAMRSDTIQNINSIVSTSLTLNITDHDGSTAKVTSTTAHGLTDGDRITISGSVNFNGTFKVEVESSTVFYINVSGGPYTDESSLNGFYATVTTATRSTAYGLQLESASHGFNSNETIHISGTTSYNGSYLINVLSATTFNIPISSSYATETSGTATLAKVIVRRQGSVTQILQGENVVIGGTDTEIIRQYTGMSSLTSNTPEYTVPIPYNTLDGMANYNSTVNENLTARIAKLTAMMADKAQDKTIKFLPSNYKSVTNTTSGTSQNISFTPTTPPARLDILMPGSDFPYGTVYLTGTLSLEANQVAYIEINRNTVFSYANLTAVPVANIVDVPIDENILILAVRLGTNDVWLWDGFYVPPGNPVPVVTYLDDVVQQNLNLKMVKGGDWSWNLVGETLTWSDDAYIQIPGLSENRNTITAGSVTLSANAVAYVDILRTPGAATSLTVNVASSIDTLLPNSDRVIVARRVNDAVIVGTNSMKLKHGDSKPLQMSYEIIDVKAIDIALTTLPAPLSSIDGVSISVADKVLFTNLTSNPGIYAATSSGWLLLSLFRGGSTPSEGALVSVQNSTTNLRGLWQYASAEGWKKLDKTLLQNEPSGFKTTTEATLSFNNSTRQLTITPVGSQFDYYINGKLFRKIGPVTFPAIPNTTGLYHFYFDNETPTFSTTFTPDIILSKAYVANVYWSVSDAAGIMIGEERHGLTMDGVTHRYLHNTVGTRLAGGLTIGSFTTTGTGHAAADAQLSISNGVIFDEDLRHAISHSATPSLPFQQELDPIAKIPIYYRSGTNEWRKLSATNFPAHKVTDRLGYNQNSGGWTITEAPSNGNFVAMWLFATNNINEPIIAILGQRVDSTIDDARTNNTYESISFGDLPSAEMKVIYRLIFETSSVYTNAVSAALRDVRDLRQAIDTAIPAFIISDHGALAGLLDQDHPASAIYTQPVAFNGTLSTADNDVQKALTTIDKYFASMQLREHPVNKKRVIVTGADKTKTDDTTLSQQIKNILINFNGAEIDFDTGTIYESDGTTVLGINFTPATISSGQWRWYSVQAVAALVGSDNRIALQISVIPALSDGSTKDTAPRAKFGKGIKLGQVAVQMGPSVINDIPQSNIVQLGVGSGGGGGDAELTLDAIFGESMSARTPVYVSQGSPADTGRIAGRVYALDNTNASRTGFIGFTTESGLAGETKTIQLLGLIEDFSGLSVGSIQYWHSGSLTSTAPTSVGSYKIAVGRAFSSSSIIINGDVGTSAELNTSEVGSYDLDLLNSFFKESVYNYLSPVFGSIADYAGFINTSSTASYSAAQKRHNFASGQNLLTNNLLDASYAADRKKDIDTVAMSIFSEDASLMSNITVEVSRDNGTTWRNITSRILRNNLTQEYSGVYKFEEETTFSSVNTIPSNTTSISLDNGSNQALSQIFNFTAHPRVVNQLRIEVVKTGSPSGTLFVGIYSNASGNPANQLYEASISIGTIASGTSTITFDIQKLVLPEDNYHVVISTDNLYKITRDASNNIAVRVNGSATVNFAKRYNGTAWSTIASTSVGFLKRYKDLSLLARLTATAATSVRGFGLLYGEEASFVDYKRFTVLTVGSVADVAAGYATFSSIQEALNNLGPGGEVKVLSGTYSGAITISSNRSIKGEGYSTKITGVVTVAGNNNSIENVKFDNHLVVNGNANKIDAWLGPYSLTDNGDVNDINLIWE